MTSGAVQGRPTSGVRERLDAVAEGYVRLALSLGQHDSAYVDAYYGPRSWQQDAVQRQSPLPAILDDAEVLLTSLAPFRAVEEGEVRSRAAFLSVLVSSLRARAAMVSGATCTFDEEAKALYDVTPPHFSESHFDSIHGELDRLLPGPDSLAARVDRYRAEFELPRERLADVFNAAIAECRRRTLMHVDLPASEAFALEFVRDRPWSGYNWYEGGFRSRIQVNTDLPVHLDRVVDLAAHEGYPGHHVFNALIEARLVGARGWVELTVFPLFSPLALVAEGTANFGIEVAFPGDERQGFEREVLLPLAGLADADVERYHTVLALLGRLTYAANEVARGYLDGALDRESAVEQLVRRALMARERAEQRTRFFDAYRSYVVNYNLGLDLVRGYIERRGGVPSAPARRWREYVELLLTPVPPSTLQ